MSHCLDIIGRGETPLCILIGDYPSTVVTLKVAFVVLIWICLVALCMIHFYFLSLWMTRLKNENYVIHAAECYVWNVSFKNSGVLKQGLITLHMVM